MASSWEKIHHITTNPKTCNSSRTTSEDVQKKIPFQSNVVYGNNKSWVMDIYGTSLPRDSPILIYIHGGYWQSLNKDISSYPVVPLFQAGVRVVVPAYTLAPQASLSEIIHQIKTMVHHVLKEAANSGTRSVWIGGHSAGAHLAASLLDGEWYSCLHHSLQNIFKGLILISGIYDLTPLIYTEYNAALSLTKKEAENLSPLRKDLQWAKQLNKDFMVLLAVAENDSPEFQQQTLRYNEYLEQCGMKTECNILEEHDHFDIVENLMHDNYLLSKQIIKAIKQT